MCFFIRGGVEAGVEVPEGDGGGDGYGASAPRVFKYVLLKILLSAQL